MRKFFSKVVLSDVEWMNEGFCKTVMEILCAFLKVMKGDFPNNKQQS
jgi:hypothetical protein